MKDYRRIIRRDIDNENITIFVIENTYGEEERVLYSELDMRRIRSESSKEKIITRVIKKSDGSRLILRTHDESGNRINDEENREKIDIFLNTEKYGRKN